MGKPLKRAGIFGIIFLVLTLISFIAIFSIIFSGGNAEDVFLKPGVFNIFTILYLITPLISIGFLYGFISLGKKFDSKLLLFSGWFFVIFAILSFVVNLLFFIGIVNYSTTPNINATSSLQGTLFNFLSKIPVFSFAFNIFGYGALWPLLIIFFVVGLSLQIVFAVGLIKLKGKDVPFANWCGFGEILKIISSDIKPLVRLFEIIMFFKASQKFEQEN